MPFINRPVIKVITGMRRAGKSCLIKLIIDSLKEKKTIDSDQILYINKESLEYDFYQHNLSNKPSRHTEKTPPEYRLI